MLGRLKDLRHEGETLLRRYPAFVTRNLPRLTPGEIPVFVFHTIEPDRFEEQLSLLKHSGFRTIGAGEYLSILQGRITPRGDEVVLTIDDARSSMWTYGFPLLKRYESRAILFVIPGWTPEGPETPRSNLDDQWAGKTDAATLARIDPDDQAICTWPEIKVMHASGLVDMHSHTYFHKRVFADTKVIDVVRPGCVATASDAVYSPYLSLDMRPAEIPPSHFHGLPLFTTRSLQEGMPFLELPVLVREECQELYRAYSDAPDLLSKLQAIIDRAGLPFCSQAHALDIIREDLARAKVMLAEKLGEPDAGSQLCLPFTLGSPAMLAMARQVGTTAVYWGVSDERRINRPGDDPFHLVRLKNDFIWRLPGPQRRSLPAIYLGKTVRRLRGTNPY